MYSTFYKAEKLVARNTVLVNTKIWNITITACNMKNIIQNHNKDQNEIIISLDNTVVIIKLRRQWEHVLSKTVT